MAGSRLAGVELGGTKAIAVLAVDGAIVARHEVPTQDPATTLAALNRQLRVWQDQGTLQGLGVASFGPVGVDPARGDYGRMLRTPKPGWSNTDIAGQLTQGVQCRWIIDTDVNAAALAEYTQGSALGCESACYVTIGTGVGGGLVIGGKPVHGAMHPEIGHLRLRRVPGDGFPGCCPFHGDCVEGLVSGPALARRFGMPAKDIPDEDPRWSDVASDIGELVAGILLTTAANRIVLGGSVALGRAYLLPAIRRSALDALGDYLPFYTPETAVQNVVLTKLGAAAGPLGAVALAVLLDERPAPEP